MSTGTGIAQVRNTELVDFLCTDFICRNESTVAWKGAISMFQMLPGLRGFWPMSSNDENGNAFDLSGQGRTLTYTGNPVYNYTSLPPYIVLDGTGDYLTRADEAGLDILGTETTIASGARGLTMGGWFYVTAFDAAANDGLMGKYNSTGNQKSYLLVLNTPAENKAYFNVSGNGAADISIGSATLTAATWHFVVGRFLPSTYLDLFVNGVKTTNAVGVPASLFNSNAPFQIGAFDAGSANLNGKISLAFLCAGWASDTIIQALYQHTRSLFGVS